MGTSKKIRRNRKIKFNEDRYIDKHYIENGKGVIPLELKSINDLYMEHDYKKMELSDSVCAYIEEIAYMIPINTDIVIEVHCPEVDLDTQLEMKKAIKNNFGMEIDDVEYEMYVANRRSIILSIIGFILLLANFLLDKYIDSEIISNFLCVAWWVALWDMIEIQTLDRTDYKQKRLNYQQLYDATITFVFDK